MIDYIISKSAEGSFVWVGLLVGALCYLYLMIKWVHQIVILGNSFDHNDGELLMGPHGSIFPKVDFDDISRAEIYCNPFLSFAISFLVGLFAYIVTLACVIAFSKDNVEAAFMLLIGATAVIVSWIGYNSNKKHRKKDEVKSRLQN